MHTSHHMISMPNQAAESATVSITTLATEAVRAAFFQAREANLPVVVAEGDELVELGPNGSRTVLKQLPPLHKPSRRTIIIQ